MIAPRTVLLFGLLVATLLPATISWSSSDEEKAKLDPDLGSKLLPVEFNGIDESQGRA